MQAGTVEPALELLRVRWNALKHVWEPGLGWPFIGRQDLNDDLIRHAEIVISIRRRNLLRQIISGYISRHLRFWVGTKSEFMERLNSAYLPPLSVEEAADALGRASRALEERDRLLSILSSKRLIFYYEDFFEGHLKQQVHELNGLFSDAGFSRMNEVTLTDAISPYMERAAYKWADKEVYDRIAGIRLIDEQLGQDSTGKIFC